MDVKQQELMLSTSTTRYHKPHEIHAIVAHFNKRMGIVAKSDQTTDQYAAEMRTMK